MPLLPKLTRYATDDVRLLHEQSNVVTLQKVSL